MKSMLLTSVLQLIVLVSYCQDYSDTIEKELQFEKQSSENVFYLANINGPITVEGYDGDKIQIIAKRTITAKSSERLEKAKESVKIDVIDRLDTLIVYIKNVCGNFGKNKHHSRSTWGYNWNNCKQDFDFKIGFTVKVPTGLNVIISTINEGDIHIKGISGALVAQNINGSISILDAKQATYAHTINGDVDLTYESSPPDSSYYYTLNGDINAKFPKGFAANVTFKSYNGHFYTDITDIEQRQVMTKVASKNNGINFKVESRSSIKFRTGGANFAFETFNGNVYVRENNN